MASAITFVCNHCGSKGIGIPGDYQFQDPPWGWTWFWGSSLVGPHGCSAACWDAIQIGHERATGKVYLPDSHERKAEADARKAANPRPAAVIPAPCRPSDEEARRVYFVQRGTDGPVKIGISKRLGPRLAQLQVGFPEKLEVLAVAPGTRSDEARLHDQFHALRLSGEWFRPEPSLLEYIRTVAERRAL